jgi:hypothetical protein
MGALRRASLSLLKNEDSKKVGFKNKRLIAAWSIDYLQQVLFGTWFTVQSPWVGDLFMSLIYTCQLNRANPFDYPTLLQRHADKLENSPQLWMPWNYCKALAGSRPVMAGLW